REVAQGVGRAHVMLKQLPYTLSKHSLVGCVGIEGCCRKAGEEKIGEEWGWLAAVPCRRLQAGAGDMAPKGRGRAPHRSEKCLPRSGGVAFGGTCGLGELL